MPELDQFTEPSDQEAVRRYIAMAKPPVASPSTLRNAKLPELMIEPLGIPETSKRTNAHCIDPEEENEPTRTDWGDPKLELAAFSEI
jgi:hypothetical protein